ncbi:MAG: hypothetical protein AAGF02_03695 [Actinomycetota bacterium]
MDHPGHHPLSGKKEGIDEAPARQHLVANHLVQVDGAVWQQPGDLPAPAPV